MKRSPLRKVSLKRQNVNRQRQKLVKEILAERPICEAQTPMCVKWSMDCHEILTRARGGSIIEKANILALCRPCHTFITDNPTFAQENGFTVHSWATLGDMIAAERARRIYRGY
jgi:hypothetical protein